MADLLELRKKEAFLKEEIARNRYGLVISKAELSDLKKTELVQGSAFRRIKFAKGTGLKSRQKNIADTQWYLARDEKELAQVQVKIRWLTGDQRQCAPARQKSTSGAMKKSKSTTRKSKPGCFAPPEKTTQREVRRADPEDALFKDSQG